MYQTGVRTFIEIGPQGILTNLVKQCLEQKEFYAVQLDRKGEQGVTSLWHALGKLVAIGFNPLLNALWKEDRLPSQPAESDRNKYTLQINGTNYGKPYPPTVHSPKLGTPEVAKRSQQDQASSPPIPAHPIPSAKEHVDGPLMEKKNMLENNQTSWIQLYQELQKQLVDAHNTYQKAMAESHIAFLNSVSNLANQLSGSNVKFPLAAVSSTTSLPTHTPSPATSTLVDFPHSPPTKTMAPAPVSRSETPIPMSSPVHMHAPLQSPAQLSSHPVHAAAAPLMATARQPLMVEKPESNSFINSLAATAVPEPVSLQPEAISSNNTPDLKSILLDIVVEKTGYPAETLNMNMAIEADLGIDSIKRVEILSALAERVPNLPEVNPAELAELRTLGDIINRMEVQMGR